MHTIVFDPQNTIHYINASKRFFVLLTIYMKITIKTSKGDIPLKLHAQKTPKTVTNFIHLASTGYYDGLKFHRVIEDFMVQ